MDYCEISGAELPENKTIQVPIETFEQMRNALREVVRNFEPHHLDIVSESQNLGTVVWRALDLAEKIRL